MRGVEVGELKQPDMPESIVKKWAGKQVGDGDGGDEGGRVIDASHEL